MGEISFDGFGLNAGAEGCNPLHNGLLGCREYGTIFVCKRMELDIFDEGLLTGEVS